MTDRAEEIRGRLENCYKGARDEMAPDIRYLPDEVDRLTERESELYGQVKDKEQLAGLLQEQLDCNVDILKQVQAERDALVKGRDEQWKQLYRELFQGWGEEENLERDKAVVQAFKGAFPPRTY